MEFFLAMLKGVGGHKKFWVVFTQELEGLAILKWGARKRFPPFKREGAKWFQPLIWGSEKFDPVLRGGGGGATPLMGSFYTGAIFSLLPPPLQQIMPPPPCK